MGSAASTAQTWTSADVGSKMERIGGLDKAAKSFVEKGIDGSTMLQMKTEDIDALDVSTEEKEKLVELLEDVQQSHAESNTEAAMRRKSELSKEDLKVNTHCHKVGTDFGDAPVIINQYKVLGNLGKGAFGVVDKVLNVDKGGEFAMKILDKKKLKRRRIGRFGNALQEAQKEIAIWKKLDHAYCVNLIEVIDDPKADKIYMVSELVSHGAVMPDDTKAEPIDVVRARKYYVQLIMGLEYLHLQKIIHRDIKPGNLLLTADDNIKITDFGVSQIFGDDDDSMKSRSTSGTACFLAPEMTTGEEFEGAPVDIWATGITLYMFIFGTTPWQGFHVNEDGDECSTLPELYRQIKEDPVPYPDTFSDEALADLFSHVLCKNVQARYSLAQIKEHHWATDSGKHKIVQKRGTMVKVVVSDTDIAGAMSPMVYRFASLVQTKVSTQKNPVLSKFRKLGQKQAFINSSLRTMNISPTGSSKIGTPKNSSSPSKEGIAESSHNTPPPLEKSKSHGNDIDEASTSPKAKRPTVIKDVEEGHGFFLNPPLSSPAVAVGSIETR